MFPTRSAVTSAAGTHEGRDGIAGQPRTSVQSKANEEQFRYDDGVTNTAE